MSHLEKHAGTVMACRFCPMCRHVCTVANAIHLESTSPRGWALACYALSAGLLSPQAAAGAERLFQCAGCDRCFDDCVSQFRPAAAIRAARADLVEQGLAPRPVAAVADSVLSKGNPYGEEAPGGSAPGGAGRADHGKVLFFSGCEITYRRPEIAQALERVSAAAGVTMDRIPAVCCGAPLRNLGYVREARALAESTLELIGAGGYDALVFGCPTCQRQVTQVSREEFGLELPPGLEVLHTSQWLQRLTREGRLPGFEEHAADRTIQSTGGGGTEMGRQRLLVTYHDPCSLGRGGLGEYDAPRQVLDAMGVTRVEIELNREHGLCCGSATLHQSYPAIAGRAAGNALTDIGRTGASLLVTACPACKSAFAAAADPAALRVVDLVELVADRLAEGR